MQSYGVSNHSFHIETYLIGGHTTFATIPDPVTDECPTEIFESETCRLDETNEDDEVNTLEVQPYTDDDRADYMNGVSTYDLYKIYHHIHDSPVFEDMDPEEDAPFRYISADADNDEDVDDNDIYMIQQMILGYRDDLTRHSWEWVWKDELEEDMERFTEEPYDFVISKNWTAPEGIIFPALSTNQVQADNDKYFGYRTTKVGDCVGLGSAQVTTNDWICGDGYYFSSGEISNRSIVTKGSYSKIRKGSIINVSVLRNSNDDILTFELPIFFPSNDFDVLSVHFVEGFSPEWNYSERTNILTCLDFSKDKKPLNIPSGKILEFKLKAKKDIEDLNSNVGLNPNRGPEIIGMDEKYFDPSLEIEINELIPPDLFVEIRTDEFSHQFYIESPKDQFVNLQITNESGIRLTNVPTRIIQGENKIPFDQNFPPGIYFLIVSNDKENIVSRFFIP